MTIVALFLLVAMVSHGQLMTGSPVAGPEAFELLGANEVK